MLFACSNNSGKKAPNNAAAEIEEVSVEQIIEDLENIPTPTALNLMSLINSAGIPYMFDVTNSLANQENYLSTKQKALNIGVYSTDLSYDITYQKKAETEEYMKCILGMASDLNISIDIDKISEKFQNNIDNVETLAVTVKEMLEESQYILNQTSQTETALLFLIGSWAESSYISVSVFEGGDYNDDYMDIILNHFEYAETILKYLESKKSNSDFAPFYEQFTNIKNLTEELRADRGNLDKRDNLISAVKTLRSGIV